LMSKNLNMSYVAKPQRQHYKSAIVISEQASLEKTVALIKL